MWEIYLEQQRIHSIDTLRGFSVICYLMFHFGSWWVRSSPLWILGVPGDAFLYPIPYLGLVAAPIFIMVSGMSQRIAIERRRKNNVSEGAIRKRVIKRGLILLIIQFFLHFIYFYWEPGRNVWWWDEIATIAVSGILVYFTSKLPIKYRLLLIGLMIYVYPTLRVLFDIQRDYILLLNYNPPWSFDRFLAGMITNGTCPIIPQSSMAILGSILAEFFIKKDMEIFSLRMILLFTLIIILTGFFRSIPEFTPWDLGLHLIQTFAIWSLIFIALYWFQDVIIIPNLKILQILSNLSLSLFYIHVIFGYIVIFISGGPQLLSTYGFYIIFLLFLLFVSVFGYYWSKIRYKGSLEYLIRNLSN